VQITKAVITAAGKNQRTLPLQTLVDRDGITKAALRIIIEEIHSAGIEDICVVICPGDEDAYISAAGSLAGGLKFVTQTESLGYGHAVFCASAFVGDNPFLLLVGDHLYVSANQKRCAAQLVEIASAENCSVSAVQATHEGKLPFFGAVGGQLIHGRKGLYQVSETVEKPTPTEAEQKLSVPGLRAGYYLCFFGMHVLTPAVMNILSAKISNAGKSSGVQLTSALSKLAVTEKYLAAELQGRRYDIGVKYGLLTAQLALALAGQDRDEILNGLIELLARREIK
jgi:UTP--glucose-1-phosphate uridylyltransferase